MSDTVNPQITDALTESLAPAPEAALAGELDSLRSRAAELEVALADQALRSQAEIQNLHRRVERDIQNAHKYALEKFAGELLPVADNLERALETIPADDSQKVVREGVSLTHRQLIDTLRKFGVEQVDPVGQPFNPEQHEAVSMQPAPHAEPNSVLTCFQKGYLLNGRLLRAAMVVVATK